MQELTKRGIEIHVVISEKDILKDLLDTSNTKYYTLADNNPSSRNTSKLIKLFKSSNVFYRYIAKLKPDLIIGCLSQISYIGFLLRIPTIFNAEDDIDYTMKQGLITYPFIKHILTPYPTNTGIFRFKRIPYDGYHKLAYLHPKRFKPDREKVDIPIGEKYFLLRFANLKAHHDKNAKGISNETARKLIEILKLKGRVLISAERELPQEFDRYKFTGNIHDIHHYLYYASLYIGDSQSMAIESSILGTPNIRFNNFVGRISVLNELENKYQLTKGIHSSEIAKLIDAVDLMTSNPNIFKQHEEKRAKLVQDKIDVTAFLVWFIENYPNSKRIMRENPEYQYRFK